MPPALRFRWDRAIRAAEMPATRKLIAYTLATYASSDGTRVRPGTVELIAATGLKERCIQGHVRALRDDGWIVLTFQGSRAGRPGMADEYRLTLPPAEPDHRHGDAGAHRHGGAGGPNPDHRHGDAGGLLGYHRNGGAGGSVATVLAVLANHRHPGAGT